MRPIRVHLDDDLRPAGEGDPEAVEVSPAETLLGGSVADANPGVGAREAAREAAGAVG